jgi:elongation factor P
MLSTSDFKRNLIIEIDGKPWQIVDVSFNSPSARSSSMIVKTRVKSLLDGTVVDRSFRGGDKVAEPDVERRACQYLYSDPTFAHFMDSETYDQFQLAVGDIADQVQYLHDGIKGTHVMLWNGGPISLTLPPAVELEITDTAPSIKGATAQAQTKPATLTTGLQIQVPAYISQGEVVRVDTRTGEYLQRVSR